MKVIARCLEPIEVVYILLRTPRNAQNTLVANINYPKKCIKESTHKIWSISDIIVKIELSIFFIYSFGCL